MKELLAKAWCSLTHLSARAIPHANLGVVLVCVECRRVKAVAS